MNVRASTGDRLLWLIGGFKLLKGLVLIMLGFAALRLLHRDVAEVVWNTAFQLHLDPGGRFVGALLERFGAITPRGLEKIAAGAFIYATLVITEGIGLVLRKRWAEYFTVIVTASFVPLEALEVAKHATVARMAVMAINVGIVAYLVMRLRAERPAAH